MYTGKIDIKFEITFPKSDNKYVGKVWLNRFVIIRYYN